MLTRLTLVLTLSLTMLALADDGVHLPTPPPLATQPATLLRSLPVIGATNAVFLPHSTQLAVAADNLEIWDYQSGRRLNNVVVQDFPTTERLRVSSRGDFVFALCFTDHDHDLGGSAIALWDVKRQKWARIQRTYGTRDRDFAALDVSPDGKRLATSQISTATHDFRNESQKTGRLRLWDARTGRLPQTLRRGRFYSLLFSPNGEILFASTEQGGSLLNIQTGAHIRLQNAGGYAQCFSPDGEKIVTVRQDQKLFGGEIRAFSTTSGRLLYRVFLRWSNPGGVCFSPDGSRLLVGGGSGGNQNSQGQQIDPPRGEVLFLRASDGKVQSRLLTPGQGEVSSLALTKDGRTLATVEYGGGDSGVKIWRLP